MYSRLLVALGGSELSEGILPYARSFARTLEIPVELLQGEGLERVSSLLLEGNAAEKIIDLARERAPSLIAMCSHGRTSVGGGVLGIVTDRIVRHAGDPVLIIRAATDNPRSAS
jgi:nucleotide-binding universal stress UspA family protein